MGIVLVSNKKWHGKYVEEIKFRTDEDVFFISSNDDLTVDRLSLFSPKWVFFIHWSNKIEPEIFEKFNSVVFHMTDLPFGRGGSPLQNLIARGIYETKISAIRCSQEIDAGDVYMKVPLSLWGTAEEIFLRAAELTKEMIIELVLRPVEPQPQIGKVVKFKRRKPAEGNLSACRDLCQIFDYIRMLDAESYPPAFLETDKWRLEFSRASLRDGEIIADVRISMRKEE